MLRIDLSPKTNEFRETIKNSPNECQNKLKRSTHHLEHRASDLALFNNKCYIILQVVAS